MKTNSNSNFRQVFESLGFVQEEILIISDDDSRIQPELYFLKEHAKKYGATAVYFRTERYGNYTPLIYFFDYTCSEKSKDDIINLQNRIWISGFVPLACILEKTNIKILNCTKSASIDNNPDVLSAIELVAKAHHHYSKTFAAKVKSGQLWTEEDFRNVGYRRESSYHIFLDFIKQIRNKIANNNPPAHRIN